MKMHPAVRMIKELIDRHNVATRAVYEASGTGGRRKGDFLWLDTRNWNTMHRTDLGPLDISCAPAISGAWYLVGKLTAVEDDLILEESHRTGSRTQMAWSYAAPGCDRAIFEYVVRVSLEKLKWAGHKEVIRLDEEPSSNLGAGR